jgi:hypothetical protein
VEEARAHNLIAHRAAIAAHDTEPIDPAWASQIEPLLRKDLSSLSSQEHFRISALECRSHSCIATLAFRSVSVARQRWQALLVNSAMCGSTVTLEDPKDADAVYELTVIYDCPRPTGGSH